MSEQWYVTTNWFKDGGMWLSGPYSTRDDALTARATIEKMANRNDYYVDSAPAPATTGDNQPG
jgi:hypothetical protein